MAAACDAVSGKCDGVYHHFFVYPQKANPAEGRDLLGHIQLLFDPVFGLSHIDRMPLGDMTFTIHSLITLNSDIDFLYRYSVDGMGFTLDTREFKEILGGVPLNSPEVSEYIKSYLDENTREINGSAVY